MPRLINADELTAQIMSMAIDKAFVYGEDAIKRSKEIFALAMVTQAPTIDAIPIEWLIRMRNKHNNDGFAWIYEAVMDDWREEHAKTD